MPPWGSADVPVKAGSPEWGRSEAESLDRAEASPTIESVMAPPFDPRVLVNSLRYRYRGSVP